MNSLYLATRYFSLASSRNSEASSCRCGPNSQHHQGGDHGFPQSLQPRPLQCEARPYTLSRTETSADRARISQRCMKGRCSTFTWILMRVPRPKGSPSVSSLTAKLPSALLSHSHCLSSLCLLTTCASTGYKSQDQRLPFTANYSCYTRGVTHSKGCYGFHNDSRA